MAKNKKVEELPIEEAIVEVAAPKELAGRQTIIGIKGGLVLGKEYSVSSDIAKNLISRGFAKIK